MKKFIALSVSDIVFIILINVKMPTIVGILTLMSRINFVLSWVEPEKSFITSGPDDDVSHNAFLIHVHRLLAQFSMANLHATKSTILLKVG